MIRHEAQSNVDVDMSLNFKWKCRCSNFLTYFTCNLAYVTITKYHSSIQLLKILNKQLNIFLYLV